MNKLNLRNWRILYKLLLVVGMMASVTALVALIGIAKLSGVGEGASALTEAGNERLSGARINQAMLMISRAEYRIAADPRPEILREVIPTIQQYRSDLEQRLREARRTADAEQARLLDNVE